MRVLALASLIALTTLSGVASAQMAPRDSVSDRHTMDGEVTKVDVKKGWVDIKAPEGRMKLHFPSPALETVKVGDSITVELGMKKISSAK